MRTLKLLAEANGNNKANYTFPAPARIRSIRWAGNYIGAVLGDTLEAEVSRSPQANFAASDLLASQSISQVTVAGVETASGFGANEINVQQMVDVKIGANETIYFNVDNGSSGTFRIAAYVDFD